MAANVTPKQETFIAAMVAGKTVAQAAAVAGTSERHVYRWLKEPAVQERMAAERRELARRMLDIHLNAAADAAMVVLGMMNDSTTPAGVRLRAALAVTERVTQWIELADLQRRIEELEAYSNASQDQ